MNDELSAVALRDQACCERSPRKHSSAKAAGVFHHQTRAALRMLPEGMPGPTQGQHTRQLPAAHSSRASLSPSATALPTGVQVSCPRSILDHKSLDPAVRVSERCTFTRAMLSFVSRSNCHLKVGTQLITTAPDTHYSWIRSLLM